MKPILEFKGKYFFLSNFYEMEFEMDGELLKSGEHAYQREKTLDAERRQDIVDAPSPGSAKKRGRRVILRDDWECIKIPVMAKVLHSKFSYPEMERRLLSTGDSLLVEGNTWGDAFWGFDLIRGFGQNMLGRLLMQLRKSRRDTSLKARYDRIADSEWFKEHYSDVSLGDGIPVDYGYSDIFDD